MTRRVYPSYAALTEHFGDGEAQLVWAPPLVALELEEEAGGRLVVCSVRGGSTMYHSAIFSRPISGLSRPGKRSLGELRDRSMAWVGPESAAGYLVPRLQIAAEGFDPDELLGEQRFFHTHEAVGRAVLAGEVDFGATFISTSSTDSRVLSAGWFGPDGGTPDGVDVIRRAGPIPSESIVAAPALPPGTLDEIAAAFCRLTGPAWEESRSLFRADGFEAVRPTHYNPLRELRAKAAARSG